MSKVKRNISIDCFKGMGALLIVYYHYSIRYEELFIHRDRPFFLPFNAALFVYVFFIISGYFINQGYSKDYFLNKLKKLYPAYAIAVTIVYFVSIYWALPGRDVSTFTYIKNLFIFPNLIGTVYVDGAHWYLIDLIYFYLIYYIFKRFIQPRIRYNRKTFMCLLIIILLVITNLPDDCNYPFINLFIKLIKRLSSSQNLTFLIFGNSLYNFQKNKQYFEICNMSLCLINIFTLIDHSLNNFIFMFFSILLFILVAYQSKIIVFVFKRRFLLFLGGISYELYLVHQNLGFRFIKLLENLGLNSECSIALTICVMIMLAYYINKICKNVCLLIYRRT